MKDNDDEPQIDWERQKMARTYARLRMVVMASEGALGLIYIVALLATGAAVTLRTLVGQTGEHLITVGGYVFVLYAAYSILLLPLSFYAGYLPARRYGISTQSASRWLLDHLKGFGITLILVLVFVETLYFVISAFPTWWWLVMALVTVVFTVLLTNLTPILLVPLFYRLAPIEDTDLAAKLVNLSARAGAKVQGVYRIDLSSKTTAANAALMGLGNTRRIVLGDTLLSEFTDDEIETVYAHELGHHVHGDIPVMILVQSVSALAGFYLVGRTLGAGVNLFGLGSISDVASLPLIALAFGILGFIWMPVTNAVSRWLEHRADMYALKSTGKARAFRNALVRLCNQNLAVLRPNKWVELLLYDHPTIGSRISLAEEFARHEG